MHLENTTPFEVGFTLAFDPQGREMVVVACKATLDFPANSEGICTVAPHQIGLQMADELGPEPALAPIIETDFAPFKPRCDVLAIGPAHTQNSVPAKTSAAGLEFAGISKFFRVMGPRVWEKRLIGHFVSEPEMYTTLPIDYAHAWGGTDPHPTREGRSDTYQTNPAGLGYYPFQSELDGLRLPHTETVDAPIDNSVGNYKPMAFGPVGRHWLPRRTYTGTYDDQWQETRMPFPPTDLDARFFQCAPVDQQVSHPKGGERFRLRGMHPSGDQTGQLPDMKVVMRFERKSGRMTQKVGHLDTITFLPEASQVTLVWRTFLKPDRDLFDLRQTVVMVQ